MITEALKPFLSTSPRVDSVTTMRLGTASHCRSGINLKGILFSTLTVILFVCLFGFMMYTHYRRISEIESKVQHLAKIVWNMQARLGTKNLDDYKREFKLMCERPRYRRCIEYLIQVCPKRRPNLEKYLKLLVAIYDPVFTDQPNISVTGSRKLIGGHNQEFRNGLSSINYEEFEGGNKKNGIINNDSKGNEYINAENILEIPDEVDLYNDFFKFNASWKSNTIVRNPRAIKADLFNQNGEKPKNAGLREHAGEGSLRYLKDQKKMVIPRVSRDSDIQNETNILPNEEKNPKNPPRRGTHLRKYKNSIMKKAKSGRQIEAVVNTPAAHFHLNRKIPDRFASIKIDSFSGDMYIGHPSWSNEINVDKYFKVESGVLTVYEPGLYYVYAQVCYNNTHDQNGFVIFHGNKPFLQCLNTVPTNMPHKIHTCHTSGLIYLKEHETIHLRDFHSDRNAILKDANNRSYFGLIKI